MFLNSSSESSDVLRPQCAPSVFDALGLGSLAARGPGRGWGGYSEPAPRGQPCPSAPDGSESGSDPPIHISFVFPSVPVVLHTCQHWGLFYLFFFFFL